MSDNTIPYFSHDCNARADEKLRKVIIRHGSAGYGVFFMLIEMLAQTKDYTLAVDYDDIAFELHERDVDIVRSVIEDFGLFTFNEDRSRFYSESFKRRMDLKTAKKKARTEASKKALEARWKDKKKGGEADVNSTDVSEIDTDAKKNDTDVSEIDTNGGKKHTNKSKVKESKDDISPNVDISPPNPLKGETSPCGDIVEASPSEQTKKFIKPTVQMVQSYMLEYAAKHNVPITFTAQGWIDHYESNGWMVGRTKMKNWKSAIHTWFNQRHYYADNRTIVQRPITDYERQKLEQQQRASDAARLVADMLANDRPPG